MKVEPIVEKQTNSILETKIKGVYRAQEENLEEGSLFLDKLNELIEAHNALVEAYERER